MMDYLKLKVTNHISKVNPNELPSDFSKQRSIFALFSDMDAISQEP